MRPNDPRIDEIVSLVVDRLKKQSGGPAPAAPSGGVAPAVHRRRRGVFDDVDTAVAAARQAAGSMSSRTNATRPSAMATLTPPACRLRAARQP